MKAEERNGNMPLILQFVINGVIEALYENSLYNNFFFLPSKQTMIGENWGFAYDLNTVFTPKHYIQKVEMYMEDIKPVLCPVRTENYLPLSPPCHQGHIAQHLENSLRSTPVRQRSNRLGKYVPSFKMSNCCTQSQF